MIYEIQQPQNMIIFNDKNIESPKSINTARIVLD